MKKIEIEEFFKTSDYYSYSLNPSATKLAYLKKINKRGNLFVKDLKNNEEIQLTNYKDRSISTYSWLDNETLFFLKDNGGDENHHLFTVDINKKNITDLTPWDGVKVAGVSAFKEEVFYENKKEFENVIEVMHNKRNKTYFDTYRYNVKTKEWTMIIQNDENIVDVLENSNYEILYRSIGVSGGTSIQKKVGSDFKEIKFVSSKDSLSLEHIYEDENKILALSNIGRDKIALVKYDLDLNENSAQLIYQDDLVDIDDVILERRKNYKLIAVTMDKEYLEIKWFDDEKKQEYEEVKSKIISEFGLTQNSYVFKISTDISRDFSIYSALSDNMLVQYFYFNKLNNEITRLNYKQTNLNPENLVEMKPISFIARDGLKIHGYLTMPKNQTKNVPFIINVHGGPWVRDSWGYDPEVQFFANRGYGVLQINYRISTGYGKEFFTKGWKQWGLSMQDDVTDATFWAIENGYAKKDAIAIYGGSYGGYAALMGIVKEPDLYAASVDIVGVSDLFALWDSFPPYWQTPGNIFEEALGNPHENVEYAKSVSPVYHVDKIKTPLMIVQGANDPRVPQEQSELIIDALKKRNVAVEYLLKNDEGHGFRNEENRFEMYAKVEKFLDKHLK
ncbi:dipeptidyl aminopeptidase/acylaminoacyl peptidase [Mycoplasma testudineum]|uniref:Dipeptidyl aminopeptidase/acylaminoacyl peptidase n=1 Tax=Mycoplasma testudineum TaxID=244584 RepID=A0A4V3C326_9MOLU|nr:S9 family peptidase [Mycoplasma testudineum]OYD26940.1 S9 family peptidase [Mycoplasma testudineum]TDO20489.1 dipeptidyl aminopeptidase/acylaminoacyl peptidase [Mycoplasma testudineum]